MYGGRHSVSKLHSLDSIHLLMLCALYGVKFSVTGTKRTKKSTHFVVFLPSVSQTNHFGELDTTGIGDRDRR